MDCRLAKTAFIVTTIVSCGLLAEVASAQRAGGVRMAYNPVSGRTEPDTRYRSGRPEARAVEGAEQPPREYYDEQDYVDQDYVEPASYCDCGSEACTGCAPSAGYGDVLGCGDVVCGDAACCDSIGCDPCLANRQWYTGFEATFVKPHFGSNIAFTTTDNVGSTTSISDTSFDYDLEFSPRVFVGFNRGSDVGFRATWWHFDHSAKTASANPPTNGLGQITHPDFGSVDLSSTTPTDLFVADTDLNAYTIDLEATKSTDFCSWKFGMGCGLRYAYAEQGYVATLNSNTPQVLGRIDYHHSIEGFGPTVSFDAFRPYGCRSGMFCKARGSVLFGDAKSRLVAGEDLTLTAPSETIRTTANDDLLSICELQVGYRWNAAPVNCRAWRPFCSVAMEGQLWDGAGNASSQDGTLGFFGFNSAVGVNW